MITTNHGIENDTNWTRGRRIECLRRSVVLLRDEEKKKQKETKKNNTKQATQNKQQTKNKGKKNMDARVYMMSVYIMSVKCNLKVRK